MRKKYASRISFEEDVPNAMMGVSNLADVMLVLAVGIMLALVVHWHINVGGSGTAGSGADPGQEVVVSEEDTHLQNASDLADNPNLEERGTVFVDRTTGKMYLVEPDE